MVNINVSAVGLLLAALILGAGCGGGGGGGGDGGGGGGGTNAPPSDNNTQQPDDSDTSDLIYSRDKLLNIEIEMDPDEYDILRREGRSFPQVFAGCYAEFPEYTHFTAEVTVDGEALTNVDIRKKGFLGSLSTSRPSLKLDFDDHVIGQRLEGLERLTLNNDRQDTSHTHQCMTYEMWRNAGLPAPRCNFARVSMNGRDLGIYTNVEPIKKHFLRRNFDDEEGNLYEAQVADFGNYIKENFQLKTNKGQNDRSDLDAVVAALDANDENLPTQLAEVIDLDEFITFWAMEVITGHWDGAAGNANNYYIYHDPSTDLFHYIPWGTDGAMALYHVLAPGTGPLYRYTTIPTRLYGIPEYRDRFHSKVLALLDLVWDEDLLNAEVDRIRNLTGTPETEMAGTREFLSQHEERVRSAIAGDLEQWEHTIKDRTTICNDSNITSISGSFAYDPGSDSSYGSFEFVAMDGALVTGEGGAWVSEWEQDPDESDNTKLTIWMDAGTVEYAVVFDIENTSLDDSEIYIHGVANILTLVQKVDGGSWALAGRGGIGSIIFDEAPVLAHHPSFSFSSDLWWRIPGQRF
ncbi:MAG: CotH kinase family protein [Desulfobacterales bacterium]